MNIHIDRLSFLLGFILASLAWFLLSKFRAVWPALRTQIERKIQEFREQNLSGLEHSLRQETIAIAQRQHLAARMFPLEEILVEPRLLAPPDSRQINQTTGQEAIIPQLVPYLPDQPQLASQLHLLSVTVDEAVKAGRAVVIIARPGTGKTVALADFAMRAARRQCSPEIAGYVPIYGHIHELDLPSNPPDDPTAPLQAIITRRVPVIYHRQAPSFLQNVLSGGRALLILDGVDELPPQHLTNMASWLKSLRSKFPSVVILTTGDPAYLDGLLSAGFIPLALARWQPETAGRFVQRWRDAWDRVIAQHIPSTNGSQPVDTRLLELWLTNPAIQLTPLEWTMRIWGLFAGDLTGPQPVQAIEAYVRRTLPDQGYFEPLAHLSAQLIQTGQAALALSEAEVVIGDWISRQASRSFGFDTDQQSPQAAKKDREKTKPLSAGAKMIDALVEAGLLIKYPNKNIAFLHPGIVGFLASRSQDLESLQETPPAGVLCWSIQIACLRNLFAQGKATELVDQLLAEDTAPLYTNLAWLCSFASDQIGPAPWSNRVMRASVQRLQDESLPIPARARLVSALCENNDPSIVLLFRQLLTAPSTTVRWLAALGVGALRDTKAVNELTALLNDTDPAVRTAACLALAHMPAKAAREAVAAALSGDDDMRQIAAEVLASIGPAGHEILLAAIESPDLFVRRAAVFGLALIDEPWAYDALEKRAIADAQWIVRNSAAQALELRGQPRVALPQPLPPPSEAGWLIQFAGRFGDSVPRGQSPLPILLKALREGSPDEQRAAMQYLRRSSDPVAIKRLLEVAWQASPVSDAAAYALWWLSASGVQIPAFTNPA